MDYSIDDSSSRDSLDPLMSPVLTGKNQEESDFHALKLLEDSELSPDNKQFVNKEINLLMEQFSVMTTNKNMIFKIINQLQQSYKMLLKKSEDQDEEIKHLREENKKLSEENHNHSTQENQEMKKLKITLETCESKLSTLEADMSNYQKLSDQENKKLVRKNSLLKVHLQQALHGLEKYKNVAINVEKMYSGLYEKCKNYTSMLREKGRVTNEIVKAAVEQMKSCTSQQVFEVDDFKEKYEKVLAQQEVLEFKWKLFEENDIKKLHDVIVHNEKTLENELQKFTHLVQHNLKIHNPDAYSDSDMSQEELLKMTLSISTINSHIQQGHETSARLEENKDKKETKDYDNSLATPPQDTQVCEEIQTGDEPAFKLTDMYLKRYRTTIDNNYELECICETFDE